jgi:hypothetical protein
MFVRVDQAKAEAPARRWLLWLLLLGCLSLGTGCYLPLPYLHKRCDPIEGTVVDGRTGQPVKSATVWVHNQSYDDAVYKTQTDSEGHYRLDAQCVLCPVTPFLVDGNYLPSTVDIWVDAPGYKTMTYKGYFLAGTEARPLPARKPASTEPPVGKFSEGAWHFTPIRLVPEEPSPPSAKASSP